MYKKIILLISTFLILTLFGCKTNGFKLDVFGIFDLTKNTSLYTISDVKLHDVEVSTKKQVTGYIVKGDETLKEPYVVVVVEFYNKGFLVDKKTTTLNVDDLIIYQKRKFQVETDKEFTDYKYYLLKN